MNKRCAIVGSGIGGMALSIRLIAQGWDVEIYEKNDRPGGKINEVRLGEYRFDFGPTVLTLPQQIDELFNLHNKDPRKYFVYHQLDELSRYFFEDGKELTAFRNVEKYADEARQKISLDAKKFFRFVEDARVKFDLTEDVFLKSSLHQLKNYLRWKALRGILLFSKVGAFTTMAAWNKKLFGNSYMERIVNRYAEYNGSDPFQMPSTFNVIAHVEMNMGVYFVSGGMIKIIEALSKLCHEIGVKVVCNSEVQEIVVENKCATGVLVNNEFKPFDLVVSNSDVYHTHEILLKNLRKKKYKIRESSSSVVIFFWGIQGTHNNFGAHNFIFGSDCQREFNEIFKKGIVPTDGAIYLNIGKRLNDGDAPENCENWFVMMNVPAIEKLRWDQEIAVLRKSVLARFSTLCGFNFEEKIVTEHVVSPLDIERNYYSYKGSIYGPSSNSLWSAFLRQSNFSNKIKNLFYTGGSVHPGAGIPLCLNSAEITAQLIKERVKS